VSDRALERMILSYAGEYLVAARLSSMGYLAVLTPRAAPGIDVLVYDIRSERVVDIQVKTVRGNEVPLGIQVTRENIDMKLAEKIRYTTIVVKLDDNWREAKFYVVPPEDLHRIAKEGYFKWLKYGRHRKPVEELEKTKQSLVVKIEELEPYLENGI